MKLQKKEKIIIQLSEEIKADILAINKELELALADCSHPPGTLTFEVVNDSTIKEIYEALENYKKFYKRKYKLLDASGHYESGYAGALYLDFSFEESKEIMEKLMGLFKEEI